MLQCTNFTMLLIIYTVCKNPYRHEMPTDKGDPLAHQNMRDRFYGKDDPVAQKVGYTLIIHHVIIVYLLYCSMKASVIPHCRYCSSMYA
jgi:hypothetical protein